MNKKFLGVAIFLVGVLIFMGAGCAKKSPSAGTQKQTDNNPAKTEQTNGPAVANLMSAESSGICESATEIDPPNAQAKEIKTIFNEAGGQMKFIATLPKDSLTEETFIYVLENKPPAAKIEAAFKKHGYEIIVSDNAVLVSKNNVNLSISLADKDGCQEVVAMKVNDSFKLGGEVTQEECNKFLEIGRLADLRYNNLEVSWINTIKLYNYWYMLAAKHGVTKEEVAKVCREKLGIK